MREPTDPAQIDDHWFEYALRMRRALLVLFWQVFHMPTGFIERRIHRAVMAFLRPLEAVVRNALLIRAAGLALTLDEPAPRPVVLRPACGGGLHRVSFRLLAPERRPFAGAVVVVSSNHGRMIATNRLMGRIEALNYVLDNARPIVERFARRLRALKARKAQLPNFEYVPDPHPTHAEHFEGRQFALSARAGLRLCALWNAPNTS